MIGKTNKLQLYRKTEFEHLQNLQNDVPLIRRVLDDELTSPKALFIKEISPKIKSI